VLLHLPLLRGSRRRTMERRRHAVETRGARLRTLEEIAMQKITPCLWFDDNAEEAVAFYVSVFKDSRIKRIGRYGKASSAVSGRPKGSVMTISFELAGQEFLALNGGPVYKFSPAISLIVNCRTQKEIDAIWTKLSASPDDEQCGWLKDRFGVSWQI